MPDEHLPDRPSWLCRTCGDPWPCVTARTDLAHECSINSAAVGLYLRGSYLVASWDMRHDQRQPDGAALYGRIIGWLETP